MAEGQSDIHDFPYELSSLSTIRFSTPSQFDLVSLPILEALFFGAVFFFACAAR
jgi:hypothetical protein